MPAHRKSFPEEDLQAALDGSACLGAWALDLATERFTPSPALAQALGLTRTEAATVPLACILSGIASEDGPRIENVLYAAGQADDPFEVEFRTQAGAWGVRWLRLMGRPCFEPASRARSLRGLAFDLTDGRRMRGTPAERAQKQINRLADHALAMKGLVAGLSHPPLSRLVDEVAIEIGLELARRLHQAQGGSRH